MFSITVVLRIVLAAFVALPVMVRRYAPAGVLAEVARLNVDPAPIAVGVNGFALNVAVTPAGSPVTDRLTGELYPLIALSVTFKLALPPAPTFCENGLAPIE
jgi:hypothetical protein